MTSKMNIQNGKVDIEVQKVDIEASKADIQKRLMDIDETIRKKTISYILELYEEYGNGEIFGRTIVEKVTGLKSAQASKLLKMLLNNNIIEAVKGYGKGKYKFTNFI